jgi:hypothetical protein
MLCSEASPALFHWVVISEWMWYDNALCDVMYFMVMEFFQDTTDNLTGDLLHSRPWQSPTNALAA